MTTRSGLLPESLLGFNTASGMRSHVTLERGGLYKVTELFQYRKRYEVTCDNRLITNMLCPFIKFQYRKRYEVTCDYLFPYGGQQSFLVSIPQAV